MGEQQQQPNSTHRRVPGRALREIQPPAEICGARLIDRMKKQLWKEELNQELENHRRNLAKTKTTVPNGIKIRNQSSVKGKEFEAPSSPGKDSSTTDDRERRWKEELDQELEMLRSFRRNGKQPSHPVGTPPPDAKSKYRSGKLEEMAPEESSSEDQRRKWKEELEEEMQIKREGLRHQSVGLRRKL